MKKIIGFILAFVVVASISYVTIEHVSATNESDTSPNCERKGTIQRRSQEVGLGYGEGPSSSIAMSNAIADAGYVPSYNYREVDVFDDRMRPGVVPEKAWIVLIYYHNVTEKETRYKGEIRPGKELYDMYTVYVGDGGNDGDYNVTRTVIANIQNSAIYWCDGEL